MKRYRPQVEPLRNLRLGRQRVVSSGARNEETTSFLLRKQIVVCFLETSALDKHCERREDGSASPSMESIFKIFVVDI